MVAVFFVAKRWTSPSYACQPRFEICQQGEVALAEEGATTELTVRNNTFTPLQGIAMLRTAGGNLSFEINLLPRSETAVVVELPPDFLARLSPGDNTAWVALPGGEKMDLVLAISGSFTHLPHKQNAARRLAPVDLPAEALVSDESWKNFRTFYAYDHLPWAQNAPPLKSLDQPHVSVPGLQVNFQLNGRKLVPVSWRCGQPAFHLDLGGKCYKKLYLLVVLGKSRRYLLHGTADSPGSPWIAAITAFERSRLTPGKASRQLFQPEGSLDQ